MSNYFLYVGNAYPHKNLDRLIEAAEVAKVDLWIASSRNIFTKRLKTNQSVRMLHDVDDDQLSKLYKNSIALVLPSLSEGFGLPGVEAMKVGTLVLASDIPVFREIYGDNALYFDPLEVNSIAQALKKAIKMKSSERNVRISKAKDYATRYSWQTMANETLQLYSRL